MRAFRAIMILSITLAALLFAGCGKDAESPSPSKRPEANSEPQGKAVDCRRVIGKTLLADLGTLTWPRDNRIVSSYDGQHVKIDPRTGGRTGITVTGVGVFDFSKYERHKRNGLEAFFAGDKKEMHFAFIGKREGDDCVVVNGEVVFKAPLIYEMYFSKNGDHCIVHYQNETDQRPNTFIDGKNYDIALCEDPVVFAGNGSDYIAAGYNFVSGVTMVIKNGEIIAEYPSPGGLMGIAASFSDEGEDCIYALSYFVGGGSEYENISVLYYNGHKIAEFTGSYASIWEPTLDVYMSRCGKTFAYGANLDEGRSFMTLGAYVNEYEELYVSGMHGSVTSMQWSDDGRHYAFIAHDRTDKVHAEAASVYYDGKIVGVYDRVEYLDFAPGSEKIYYFGFIDKTAQYYMYPGTAIGVGYTRIGKPSISADGRHFVFKSGIENEDGNISWFVVADGAELGPFMWVGSRNTYMTVEGQSHSFFNPHEYGLPVKPYYFGGWLSGEPEFVGEEATAVYSVGSESGERYIVGKRECKEYAIVHGFVADPLGKHIAYVARVGDNEIVVIEHIGGNGRILESVPYEEVDKFIIWDSPTQFHYIARDGGKIYLVEEEIVEE